MLAGFDDGRADEGVGAGPASLLGLRLARERGWTAPGEDGADADGADADGDATGRRRAAAGADTSDARRRHRRTPPGATPRRTARANDPDETPASREGKA